MLTLWQIDALWLTQFPLKKRACKYFFFSWRFGVTLNIKVAAPKLKDFIYSCGLEMVMTRGHLKSLTCIKPRAKLKKFASSTSPYRVRFGDSSESLRLISSKLSYGRALPAICFRRNKDHNYSRSEKKTCMGKITRISPLTALWWSSNRHARTRVAWQPFWSAGPSLLCLRKWRSSLCTLHRAGWRQQCVRHGRHGDLKRAPARSVRTAGAWWGLDKTKVK